MLRRTSLLLGLALLLPAPGRAQDREAAFADALSLQDADQYLRGALAALKEGRPNQALEFLERAESRLLTRAAPAPAAGKPVERGPVADISAARAAVARRDLATARSLTEKALAWVERRRHRR